MGAAFTKALDIAESLGDPSTSCALSGACISITPGAVDTVTALPFAQKFHDLAEARTDPNDRLFGERMVGAAKHFLGDQISARRHLEQVLAHYAATDHGRESFASRMSFASGLTCEYRRVCSLRGCCGCRGFRIRRCALPK